MLGTVDGARGAAEGEVAEDELDGGESDLGVLESWSKRGRGRGRGDVTDHYIVPGEPLQTSFCDHGGRDQRPDSGTQSIRAVE